MYSWNNEWMYSENLYGKSIVIYHFIVSGRLLGGLRNRHSCKVEIDMLQILA